MEGMDGPEVDSLRTAHKRAQEAVKGVPVDVQIKECESFLARAASHLEELDTTRATICQNIESSRKRLAELKAQSQAHTVVPPMKEGGGSAAVEGDGVPIASTNRRNAFESPSGQSTRRASFQEAMSPRRISSSVRRGDGGVVGRTPRRSSEGIGDGTAPRGGKALSINDNRCRRVAPVDSEPEDSPFCVGEYSEVITHQCGLFGVRVGEASHPGPRVRDRHRRRVVSSDDELLERPIVGRDVFPRTEAGSVITASGAHLGEEFDLTIAESPDEATVPDSVIDALEADLIDPTSSVHRASKCWNAAPVGVALRWCTE